jgi:hypothetical protein
MLQRLSLLLPVLMPLRPQLLPTAAAQTRWARWDHDAHRGQPVTLCYARH